MKQIKELQEKLSHSNKNIVCDDTDNDNKVHLLYISPTLNSSGFHRMIAPAMELNNTRTHKTVITSLRKHDFNETLMEQFFEIDEKLLAWADYIIFPPISQNLEYLLLVIKAINYKVQFTMDFDRNYFKILSRGKGSSPRSDRLKHNLKLMHLVLGSTKPLVELLKKVLGIHLKDHTPYIAYLPTAISTLINPVKTPVKQVISSGEIRVGLIKPTPEDLLFLKHVFLKINAEYGKKIHWVYYGNTHECIQNELLPKGLIFELHPSVCFMDKFKKIKSLALDFVLLPANEGVYSTHKKATHFLELAFLTIPTITSVFHPAKKYIEHGKTGILVAAEKQWITAIRSMLKKDAIRRIIKTNLLNNTTKKYGYSDAHFQLYQDLFI